MRILSTLISSNLSLQLCNFAVFLIIDIPEMLLTLGTGTFKLYLTEVRMPSCVVH
jgi:hypothetical protein